MAQAFRSKRVVTPEGVRPAALIVDDGVITHVCELADVPSHLDVVDFENDVVMPGLIDAHTHINEPGRTEWEGFETATRAAAAGGFTTLVDMPLNCLPETTTVDALEMKREAAKGKCWVDWMAWGGVVGDGTHAHNREHLEPLAAAGVPGYKCFLIYPGCEGFTSITLSELEKAAPVLAKVHRPLLVHAELDGPIVEATLRLNEAGEDWRSYATYLASRPDDAELQAIAALIELCRKYRFKLHIVHLATALALPMIRAAKAEGLPLTAETCPHYLHVSAKDVPYAGTEFKCAPPLRSQENREALWEGLREGLIDLIATDHSPCPPEMKRATVAEEDGRFDKAWGGIASLSTALSVIWTEASRRGFGVKDVALWMSAEPAKLIGVWSRMGSLEVGKVASFVVVDAEAEWTVTPERLHYRHAISPYMNEHLRGVVKATYLRGECVFQEQMFLGETRGREVRL